MQKEVYLQIAFIITQFCTINGDINNKLSYYELIDTPASIGRIRRSLYTNHKHEEDEELIKDFTIKAFNRTFHLQLKPRTEVFSKSFKISVVHADGSETIAPLQEGNFYMGTVLGEDNSEVHGYFEDGNFVGTVSIQRELFTFEPAWRHIKDDKHGINSGKIVAYRRSDVKWPENEKDGRKFCKSAHAPDENSNDSPPKKNIGTFTSRRKKRATLTKNTCKIIAVADFKFFKAIGASNIYRTASYIVGVIERTDRIFRQTNWGGSEDLTGMGIELEQIRIHDTATSGTNHYNQDKSDWEIQDLLNAFGLDQTLKNYCLGHLFTHESFANNVLGLAYIAPSRSGAGGICSPTRYIGSSEVSYNTGWTTTANTKGETVLLQQADLVTAHEIGHNWGSEHDPDSSECAPSTILGDGKYLMYPFSVSGYDANNFKFSTCSKVKVSAVLEAKAESCFEEPEPVTLCGNGILNEENGEECDAGFLGRYGQDKCCTSQCKLTPTSTCSPVNHECCLNCQKSPVGTVCRNDTFTSCKRVGYCDGTNLNCPAPVNADDNTDCIDGGSCQGGQCLGFCEAKGLFPCLCDDVETSCLRCCRNATHGLCKQTDPLTFLSDGRPCAQGYCLSGTCKKAAQSVIERLFNFIDKITLNSVLIFFQDNIVGCVMVFTLLVWIPIACCITYRDIQREKRFHNEFDIEPRTDRQFLFDEDKRKVKVPDRYLRPRTPKEIFVAKDHKRY